MKQRAHGYIAARAVALLQRDPATKPFAQLLTPHLGQAAVGAWLPDQKFFKDGVGDTQNHVLKMRPYDGENAAYYVMPQKKLLKGLSGSATISLITADNYAKRLPVGYWETPFRGDCPRGEHPANCASALATTLGDMLTLGNEAIQDALKKKEQLLGVPEVLRARPEQIALYAFMLSHFPADAHMPCHTDGRTLALYNKKLHERWEKHIDKMVESFPDDKAIAGEAPKALLDKAERAFPLDLPHEIPALGNDDVWSYLIQVCRGSFALSCVAAPLDAFPFESDEAPSFDDIFAGDDGKTMLNDMTLAILSDAVLDVAMIWKNVWKKVAGK